VSGAILIAIGVLLLVFSNDIARNKEVAFILSYLRGAQLLIPLSLLFIGALVSILLLSARVP
jgi:hypothetical protein